MIKKLVPILTFLITLIGGISSAWSVYLWIDQAQTIIAIGNDASPYLTALSEVPYTLFSILVISLITLAGLITYFLKRKAGLILILFGSFLWMGFLSPAVGRTVIYHSWFQPGDVVFTLFFQLLTASLFLATVNILTQGKAYAKKAFYGAFSMFLVCVTVGLLLYANRSVKTNIHMKALHLEDEVFTLVLKPGLFSGGQGEVMIQSNSDALRKAVLAKAYRTEEAYSINYVLVESTMHFAKLQELQIIHLDDSAFASPIVLPVQEFEGNALFLSPQPYE